MASISAADFPFTSPVMTEAEAREMAQPLPSKRTSESTPPSTRAWMVIRSPQSGFSPSARWVSSGSGPKLRGRLLWSRTTSW